MTPELSRPFPIERLDQQTKLTVEATPDECAAVASRLGIEAVMTLVCRFALRPGEATTVTAHGALSARVRQVCAVSAESFDSTVSEDFDVRFVPEGMESEQIDVDAPDDVPYAGKVIDLGEASVEQLALALDPFPRKPGAVLPEDTPDPEVTPFAALAAPRKPRLG